MFTQVSEELFTWEEELRFQFGMTLMCRMVVIRRGRDLWVHSPLPPGPWYDEIESLGTVRFLISPSTYHCFYLMAAKERFPAAVAAGAEELAEVKPKVVVDMHLGEATRLVTWPSEVTRIRLGGVPKIAESLFYDGHSRTLISTDLVFHNERGANLITRILLGLFAPTGRPCRSKEWPLFLIKDREAFADSLAVLGTLDIERVVPAHGRILADVPLAVSLMRTGKPPAQHALEGA